MDNMIQTMINIAVAIIGALGGWMLKIIFDEQKMLRSMYERMRDNLSDNYVRKDDFRDFTKAVFAKLDRIEGKLDGKADKDNH